MNFNQPSTVLVLTKMIFNHKITQNPKSLHVHLGRVRHFWHHQYFYQRPYLLAICLLVIYSYILIKQAIIITLVNL